MPTGYTANVADGSIVKFSEFAMRCARGMGACVIMRDEPLDAPIPEKFEPSTYHDDRLRELREELGYLDGLSQQERMMECTAEHITKRRDHDRYMHSMTEQRERYEAMLREVREWEPPTDDHVGLKEFMASQLTDSIKWDCSTEHITEPVELSVADWFAAKRDSVLESIEYHEEERSKERNRAEERSAWITELRQSLAVLP